MYYNKRITSLFVFAALILVANAGLFYYSFLDMDRQSRWVNHTYEVIGELEGVISDLKDIQSAQRGYVITGHHDYLTPYDVSKPKLENRFESLHNLIQDNPEQEERLALLQAESIARVEIAASVIKTYQDKGQSAAFAMIKTGQGKHKMDEIRLIVNDMVETEKMLLAQRRIHVKHSTDITFYIAAGGLVIGLIILLSAFVMIKREAWKRARTEASLNQAYQTLKRTGDDDKIISEMSDYLQTCRDMSEAYRIISRTLPKILPSSAGSVWIYNNSRNLIEQVLYWGDKDSDSQEFDPEKCWALRLGHAHMMTPGGLHPVCEHISNDINGIAYCYPMQTQGETLGLLTSRFPAAEELDDYSKNLIERLGKQIALALANLKLQDRLRSQSVRDPLTSLFNRRYLEETMEREFSRAQRNGQSCSILILDIDHFKKYNDTRGHDAGDALLTKFAHLVRETTRKEDIACRYGGEEFVVVLPNTPLEMAEKVGHKICDATRKMKVTSGKESFGSVTVSIGVAAYPMHAETPEELISSADKALYAAKEGGRDQVRLAEDKAL